MFSDKERNVTDVFCNDLQLIHLYCIVLVMKRSQLDIFEYTDFRAWLKDRFSELKASDKKYSLRYLARKMGLSSNSHLKMVMDGSHNMSIDLARKVARFFILNKQETDFFVNLVKYGQARNTREKSEALDELRKVSQFVKLHQLELDQFDYYNDKLTLILRELVVLPDFKEDTKWIARQLPFKATAGEIHKAIDKLVRLKLLSRDEDGTLFVTNPHVTTGNSIDKVALRSYYMNGFSDAAGSLEMPGTYRHVGGITMAISRKTYDKIVNHFQEFLNVIRSEVSADERPDSVYQLVLGLHPLTSMEDSKRLKV